MQKSLCPFCMSEAQGEICPGCGKPISCAGDPTHLPVGYILEDKRNYILGAALGQGGFGVTYIAWDEKRQQKVAIKEYFPTYCSSRTSQTTVSAYRGQEETFLKGKERFLDEARMLESLSDLKSMVNVLDFFEANNSAYLVMEYLEGMSLKDYVQKNGKLPAQQFLNQLKPLMADMEKMHRRGVVHRDIAPDNIILLPDGRLKLIDFGAARSYVGDKSMTVVVKKGFAPVEQYMRKGSNASTDVYALAATIYYCITGIVPPDSAERQYGDAELTAPSVLGADILPHQEYALEQALQVQPRDRTQSIADFLKALFHAPREVPVQPVSPEPPTEKKGTTVKPRQEKTKQPKTARPTEKKKASGTIWIIAAALALCACVGIVAAGIDWPAATETVEQLATEQTEPAETQPEETLSPEEEAYNEAVTLFDNGEYGKAAIAFAKLGDFRDAKQVSHQLWDAIAERETISADRYHTVGLREDGTVVATGKNSYDICNLSDWTDIVAVSAGENHTVGLKSDGTVVAKGKPGADWVALEDWSDVVAITAACDVTLGLRADGTVLMAGLQDEALIREIADLQDVVGICYDQNLYAARKSDGTVDSNYALSEWEDVTQISTSEHGLLTRLMTDGSVHVDAQETWMLEESLIGKQINVTDWSDITSISMGWGHVLGIRSDGTVAATGDNASKQCEVGDWTDIVAVSSGQCHSVGLKSDGTVVSCGSGVDSKRGIKNWTNIKQPANRETLLVAIKLDYITQE